MSERVVTIDIDTTVVPLAGSIASPTRMLAVSRGAREKLFAPPEQPAMRGRRPSGVVFSAPDVPKEARGEQVVKPPEQYAVTKRLAKSVAEQLTGCPITCRDMADGRKQIEVVMPMERIAFEGPTWFDALVPLKTHFEGRVRR